MSMYNLSSKKHKLDTPNLEEIGTVLQDGLQQHFLEVEVGTVDCPDLTKEPFNLASCGLGGNTAILDIGGPGYLLPLYDKNKIYNMKDMINLVGIKPSFLIGAGAGPWPYAGKNCEMITNLFINGSTIQKTYIAKVNEKNEVEAQVLPSSELSFSLLANLFISEGTPSKVLKVVCKKRKSSENFISAIKLTLDKGFPNKTIGLGGTFLVKEGKVRQHVMPDFSNVPLKNEKELNQWLKFFEMSSPLVAVGTVVSKDISDFDLRLQHFHSFSAHGEAGHYHFDTTPNTVEYIGYFNVGQTLYRIDQPVKTQSFGKD